MMLGQQSYDWRGLRIMRNQATVLVALVNTGMSPTVHDVYNKQYRSVNALIRRGLIVKHDDGSLEPTDLGRECAAEIEGLQRAGTVLKIQDSRMSKHFNRYWDELYAHPKTYPYKPTLHVVCERSRDA